MNSSVGRFFCLVTRQVAYSQNCNGFSSHLLKKFEWKLLNSKIQLLYTVQYKNTFGDFWESRA